MNAKTIDQARDPNLPLSVAAIKRAAQRARELAVQTHTALIVTKEGKLIRIHPDQIREDEGSYKPE